MWESRKFHHSGGGRMTVIIITMVSSSWPPVSGPRTPAVRWSNGVCRKHRVLLCGANKEINVGTLKLLREQHSRHPPRGRFKIQYRTGGEWSIKGATKEQENVFAEIIDETSGVPSTTTSANYISTKKCVTQISQMSHTPPSSFEELVDWWEAT
jgi:hypothetical protein